MGEQPDLEIGVASGGLAEGAMLAGCVRGEPVLVVRREGRLCALAATCPHLGAPLAEGRIENGELICPWHHARFALDSGEAVAAPAFDPLARYAVEERDGRLRVTGRCPDARPFHGPARDPGRVVIVGGGAGGHACAELLARAGHARAVTMVSDDLDPPYDRTVLSKAIIYLANTMGTGHKHRARSAPMSVLSRPEFHNEEAAFAHVESLIWPDAVSCPHCGGMERITKVKANPEKRIRIGLWRCGDCKGQFTVKVGTVFEHARMPLHKMLQAVYLMTSSKKGVSAHQLHRALEITYKSAWFLAHRVREAMRSGQLAPFGVGGGVVEVDETYIGVLKGAIPRKQGFGHKMKVISLVDRATGRIQSYTFDQMITCYVEPVCRANIAKEARLVTDSARLYRPIGEQFASHQTVNHAAGEYVRGDVFTNTVEGSFSIFKRGMKGVYQHCGEQHLHRYLAEFDFRYSNRTKLGVTDPMRCDAAIKGIVGKRLTYRRLDQYAEA